MYKEMATANGRRHYDFLNSVIRAALAVGAKLDASIIKAINYHAIAALHAEAGEYTSVEVTVGNYDPPPPHMVEPLMEEFVRDVDAYWTGITPLSLATWALWRINSIHPFRNGNGRTARASCYFIICVKLGGPLPGTPILPELLRRPDARSRYIAGLRSADAGDIYPLSNLIQELALKQIGR